MFVHRSNSAEALVGALAEVVERPHRSCFEPEVIVVQSRGMERWLSIELAERLGVFANAEFPFPRAFLERLFTTLLSDSDTPGAQAAGAGRAERLLSREFLAWAIARALPGLAREKEFSAIARYLDKDERMLFRLELAHRIAQVFDQYAVYRPELVLGWEAGKGHDWQAELWRTVVRDTRRVHVAAEAQRFRAEWSPLFAAKGALPERVSIFGVASLPKVYLQVLAALAQRVEVHLFLLSPSREYWGSTRSAREIERERRRLEKTSPDVRVGRDLHFDEGHPLLGSLGRVGREFHELLEETIHYVEGERSLFRDPGSGTLLKALQSDLLALRRRGPEGAAPLTLDSGDTSLSIHSCHGPLREVEVLRDQLLAAFQADPTLRPHDVLVMAPDIEVYAPLIEVVFGAPVDGEQRIPFRVADRIRRRESVVVEAFMAALRLMGGRMKASEILDLLELEPVRRRFGISAEDLPRVQHLFHDAGVRFGIDAPHRERLGLPAAEEHTMRFGLERLFLGYALAGRGFELFTGRHPYGDLEGEAAEILGAVSEYAETLCDCHLRLAEARPPSAWVEVLHAALGRLCAVREADNAELQVLREAISELAATAARAGFDEPVPLEVMRAELERQFESERSAHEFLSGGVTFCAMLPMRSIPARVIALVGMNDGEFPRREKRLDFDKIAERPEPGDRSARNDDRYLFLETLLSARERLIICYVGRDIRDDSVRPPSVLVGELLDAIDEMLPSAAHDSFGTDGGARARLVVEHPLQAFSPRYFGANADATLFSYSAASAAAARALVDQERQETPFQSVWLPARERRAIDLEDLVRFYKAPLRTYLRERLGVRLDDEPELVDDADPIELSSLEQYKLGAFCLEHAEGGVRGAELLRALRARGGVPAGGVGENLVSAVQRRVGDLLLAAKPYREGARLSPLELSLESEQGTLGGVLRELYPSAQTYVQYSRLTARYELTLWLRHLALCAASDAPHAKESVLVGRTKEGVGVLRFRPLGAARARTLLKELVRYFDLGQRAPLPFFPETSREYARTLLKKGEKAEASALEAAERRFRRSPPGERLPIEGRDPHVECAFSGRDPFEPKPLLRASGGGSGAESVVAPSFSEVALSVFGPLLEHSEAG